MSGTTDGSPCFDTLVSTVLTGYIPDEYTESNVKKKKRKKKSS